VAEMVERFCAHARRFASLLADIDGVRIVNDVVFTQVCVSFGSDEMTREVARRLLADGTAWMTPSVWQGQAILRISVSNFRTTDADVDVTVATVRRIVAEVREGMESVGRTR
jgi:glutamate/tyrosine decarboxylase-like PLP-dependent enzyme